MPDPVIIPAPGELGGIAPPAIEPPRVKTADDFHALAPGAQFYDPQGRMRQKPWKVTDAKSYEAVPEGDHFEDPQGNLREKPRYEGLSVGAQTLFDMARTDEERKGVLAKFYGDEAVKTGPEGVYVEQPGGKRLKPGRGLVSPVVGSTLSMLAPAVGSLGGEILGAGGGSLAAPGVGTVGGALAGATLGGAAGQAFNDAVLSLAGVSKASVGQQAMGLAGAAGSSAGGTALGRSIGAVVPLASAGAKAIAEGTGAPAQQFVANILGATQVPEAMRRGAELARGGVLVRPSAVFPESPYLRKVVEFFDPEFRRQNVLKESARGYYEREASRILGDVGVVPGKPLTSATEPVPIERAGGAALRRAQAEMSAADAKLDAARASLVAGAETRGFGEEAGRQSRLSIVKEGEADARAAAQRVIDEGFADIRADVSAALKAADADANPAQLWQAVGQKLDALHQAAISRAEQAYRSAYQVAGAEPVKLGTIRDEIRSLYDTVPEELQQNFPSLTRALKDIAEGNKPVTLEQLHNARNVASARVDFRVPYADRAEGLARLTRSVVNRAIHEPNQAPAIKAGVEIIDAQDKLYGRMVQEYDQALVDTAVKQLRTGFPPDAGKLADMIFGGDSTLARESLKEKLGPELWRAVHAADVARMLDQSKLVTGETDAGRFASQVLKRVRDGSYDRLDITDKTVRLANQIDAVEGKIPIQALPGDTVSTLLGRASSYAEEAKTLAAQDPLGSLAKEVNRINQASDKFRSETTAARRAEPLGFLETTELAHQAASRILRDPDLTVAAANRFGIDSPEFTMLRQAGAWRLLQRGIGSTPMLERTLGEVMPENVQRLLFPGASRDALVRLAKDMTFLLGAGGAADSGSSIAAASRVLHPIASLSPPFNLLKYAPIPGKDFVARLMLGKYYQLVTNYVTHPAFMQWVEKGLSGPPATRFEARDAVRKAMGWGGAIGAAAGGALYQASQGDADVTATPNPETIPAEWRQRRKSVGAEPGGWRDRRRTVSQ